MVRKSASEHQKSPPPPNKQIQNTGHKRKRNTDKEVPAEKQPIVKRKQILRLVVLRLSRGREFEPGEGKQLIHIAYLNG
ncbi:hypothetical protein QQ045_011539 [Rhodiola kirilowii]